MRAPRRTDGTDRSETAAAHPSCTGRNPADDTGLLVRAGCAPITPSTPDALAGFAGRNGRPSEGELDQLEVNLLLLEAADTRVAWLTLDAVAVPGTLRDRLTDAVRGGCNDPDVVVLGCASHTHSAPAGWVGTIHPGNPARTRPDLVDELVGRVDLLARELVDAPAVPARACWSSGTLDGVGTNRLDPTGPHNRSLGVLDLRADDDDRLLAVVTDFACHPTVLDASNLRWSADWPGASRAVLRTATAAWERAAGRSAVPPVIIFLQGAAGDASTRFTRRAPTIAEAGRIGTRHAAAVLTELARFDRTPLSGSLTVALDHVALTRRPLPDPSEVDATLAAADAAVAALEEAGEAPTTPQARIARTRRDGAYVQRALLDADAPRTLDLPIAALRLGEQVWVHAPVELFAAPAQRVTELLPGVRVIGYTNGYFGYVVDERAEQSRSYEALSSFFDAAAGSELAEALAHLGRRVTIPLQRGTFA